MIQEGFLGREAKGLSVFLCLLLKY